ncbi:unnamed protein product, partial [Polarella glacialis]
ALTLPFGTPVRPFSALAVSRPFSARPLVQRPASAPTAWTPQQQSASSASAPSSAPRPRPPPGRPVHRPGTRRPKDVSPEWWQPPRTAEVAGGSSSEVPWDVEQALAALPSEHAALLLSGAREMTGGDAERLGSVLRAATRGSSGPGRPAEAGTAGGKRASATCRALARSSSSSSTGSRGSSSSFTIISDHDSGSESDDDPSRPSGFNAPGVEDRPSSASMVQFRNQRSRERFLPPEPENNHQQPQQQQQKQPSTTTTTTATTTTAKPEHQPEHPKEQHKANRRESSCCGEEAEESSGSDDEVCKGRRSVVDVRRELADFAAWGQRVEAGLRPSSARPNSSNNSNGSNNNHNHNTTNTTNNNTNNNNTSTSSPSGGNRVRPPLAGRITLRLVSAAGFVEIDSNKNKNNNNNNNNSNGDSSNNNNNSNKNKNNNSNSNNNMRGAVGSEFKAYATVQVGGHRQATEAVACSGCPVWRGSPFYFDVDFADEDDNFALVEIATRGDSGEADESLGAAVVRLDALAPQQVHRLQLPLRTSRRGCRPWVELEVEFRPEAPAHFVILGRGDALCTKLNRDPAGLREVEDSQNPEKLDHRCWRYLEHRHPAILRSKQERQGRVEAARVHEVAKRRTADRVARGAWSRKVEMAENCEVRAPPRIEEKTARRLLVSLRQCLGYSSPVEVLAGFDFSASSMLDLGDLSQLLRRGFQVNESAMSDRDIQQLARLLNGRGAATFCFAELLDFAERGLAALDPAVLAMADEARARELLQTRFGPYLRRREQKQRQGERVARKNSM